MPVSTVRSWCGFVGTVLVTTSVHPNSTDGVIVDHRTPHVIWVGEPTATGHPWEACVELYTEHERFLMRGGIVFRPVAVDVVWV